MQYPVKKEKGIVLIVTLVILVMMTLGAIALVRAMDTSTLIAGNLGFRQSTAHYGEIAVQHAITKLAQIPDLNVDNATLAYKSGGVTENPAVGQSWDKYWTDALSAQAKDLPGLASGYNASYIIHRMCAGAGYAPTNNQALCVIAPVITGQGSSAGSSKVAGEQSVSGTSQVYYRITVRLQGPRNSVSYIQTFVAQ